MGSWAVRTPVGRDLLSLELFVQKKKVLDIICFPFTANKNELFIFKSMVVLYKP